MRALTDCMMNYDSSFNVFFPIHSPHIIMLITVQDRMIKVSASFFPLPNPLPEGEGIVSASDEFKENYSFHLLNFLLSEF